MIRRRAVIASALLLLGVAPSASAVAQCPVTASAQVYELTQNAKFILRGRRPSETSTSQFMGFVDPGTPPCPETFAVPVPARNGQRKCVVNMTGTDRVSLVTGRGPISGRFTVVTADLTNPTQVDAPETVVTRGSFGGQIDFSPALQHPPLPYGTVTGHLTSDEGGERVEFFGVFLLPFEDSGVPVYLCYTLGPDLQVDLTGGVVQVQTFEMALQYPTARFDLYFIP